MSSTDKSSTSSKSKEKKRSIVLDDDSPFIPSTNKVDTPTTPFDEKRSFDVMIQKNKSIFIPIIIFLTNFLIEIGNSSDEDDDNILPSVGDISENIWQRKLRTKSCIMY